MVTVAGLEDRAAFEVDGVARLCRDALLDAALAARKEARPYPPGSLAEPQVEARGLDQRRRAGDLVRHGDVPLGDQAFDLVGGEETRRESCGLCHETGSRTRDIDVEGNA